MHGQLDPETFVHDLKPAYEALAAMKAQNEDDPDEPPRLPIKAVEMVPNVFQVRGVLIDESHVRTLLDVLDRGGDLDPITVWRCGQHALLIDGHHRLEAYRRFEVKAKRLVSIPVHWFHGSAKEAMTEAASSNVKARLQMTPEQRYELAWRWTLFGEWSKKEIAERTGVGTSTIANMRKVISALGSEYLEDVTWKKAFREFNGKQITMDDDQIEEMLEQQIISYAARMAKEFSTKLAHNPTIAARTLDRYFGAKGPDVLYLWAEELGLTVTGDRDLDEEDDLPPCPF